MEAPRYGLGTLRLFLYLDCSCTLRQAQGDASTSSATACGALSLSKGTGQALFNSRYLVPNQSLIAFLSDTLDLRRTELLWMAILPINHKNR